MFCKFCGKAIDDDAIFCNHCGKNLKEIGNSLPQTVNVNLHFGRQKSIPTNEIKDNPTSLKYDPNYKPDSQIMIAGIFTLVIIFFINIGLAIEPVNEGILKLVMAIIFIWRITATVWAYNITKQLNITSNWTWLTLLFPGIMLIVLGTKKKLIYPNNYNQENSTTQSQINNTVALSFAKNKDYKTALYYANLAIELDPNNHFAYDTRGYIKYYLQDYENSLQDLDKSIELNPLLGLKYFHRGYAKMECGDLGGAISDWNVALSKGITDAQNAIDKLQKK